MSVKRWRGVSFYVRKFWAGVHKPKASRRLGSATPTSSTNYENMDVNYRWFRQDELVRRCIVINSAYSTMVAGFETELEPVVDISDKVARAAFLEKFKYVKDYVDAVNKRVNLDQVLFVAAVKCSIYGKAGFEKILQSPNGSPSWLLSLQCASKVGGKLEPRVNDNWELEGFKFNGKDIYDSAEILYFINLELENDFLGLSDVEPVVSTCKARNFLLERDFPKITERMWAPFVHMQADTEGMTDAEEDNFLNSLIDTAEAGASTAFNRKVTSTVVSMNINLAGLVQLCDKFEETIIRNFGTPRFLINKTPENRATAYVEFEAFVNGPIAFRQRYLKRTLESSQWYDWLVGLALKEKGFVGDVPVKVKHVWKPIRASDINDMATAVTNLYAGGLGILADFPEIAFEMMGWPKENLIEWQKKQQQSPPPSSQPKLRDPSLPGTEDIEPKPEA